MLMTSLCTKAALPDGFPNQTHGGNGNCNGVPGYARPLSNCSDYGHSTASKDRRHSEFTVTICIMGLLEGGGRWQHRNTIWGSWGILLKWCPRGIRRDTGKGFASLIKLNVLTCTLN